MDSERAFRGRLGTHTPLYSLNSVCVRLKDAECGPWLDRPIGSKAAGELHLHDLLAPPSFVHVYVRLHVRMWRGYMGVSERVCAHVRVFGNGLPPPHL